ncbi:MAG: cyclic nucleotide-binding domain-containing protein [Stenomitos rutilans HA7619-LM2]|jgi:CRP-like cAMP-binding protein/HAMP domain-containing protein|nr:cyclic nucleotide-binding domain-containing protein [Stenomitos rutilans HA7619-LM2]
MAVFSIRKKVPLATSVPLIVCVALLGWVGFINARRTVDELVVHISQGLEKQVEEHLYNYLESPHLITQETINALRLGDLDLQDPSKLEKRFWYQMQSYKEVGGIEFGFQQTGAGRGIVRLADQSLALSTTAKSGAPQIYYALDSKGNPGKELSRTDNYDVRKRPWFQTAMQERQEAWTRPNQKFTTKQFRISSVHPLFDTATGQPLGVLSVDFYLNQISSFLQELKESRTGKIFIVEPSGELIATSTNEALVSQKDGKTERLNVFNSQDPLIRAAAQAVQTQYKSFSQVQPNQSFRFSEKGAAYLVYIDHFTQVKGLDWLVAIVVPEKAFMREAEQTAQFTLILGGVVLLLGLAIGLLATRWLVNPLLRLNTAAAALKAGQFDPTSITQETARADEIGQLARVFLEMAEVVQSREQSLQSRVQHLMHESDQAKKAALAMQTGNGMINPHLLLARSRQARLYAETRRQNLPELLHSVSYFQAFTQAEIQRLINLGYERQLEPQDVLCREGEPGDAFFIILSGSVEIYAETLSKRIAVRTAGDFLGELSLLLGIPRTATIRALEPVTLFVVDQKSFQSLLRDYPDLGEQVAQKLNERQAELQQRKEELRKHGLLGDEAAFSHNFLSWSRQRLKLIFGATATPV